MDNYFADAKTIIRLKEENEYLEKMIKQSSIGNYKNVNSISIQDKYFEKDIEYIRLLTKNAELKRIWNEMMQKK